jgi:hypothetical protein
VGIDSVLIFFTGYTLINSVIKIRQALRERKGDVNLKAMKIHATAFGLFVVAFIGARVILVLTCTESNVNTCVKADEDCFCVIDRSNAGLFYKTVLVLLDIASFISQILLCWILWDLGTADTVEPIRSQASGLIVEIETMSFDSAEAEMQARIWNMFAR